MIFVNPSTTKKKKERKRKTSKTKKNPEPYYIQRSPQKLCFRNESLYNNNNFSRAIKGKTVHYQQAYFCNLKELLKAIN
jgi:hypothetical protein